MKIKVFKNLAWMGLLVAMAGCETTEGYRQHMDLNAGKSSDQILSEWGSPWAKETMLDGGDMWVFRRSTESKSGGYWTERNRTREETIIVDGKKQTRTVTFKEPYYEPEVITRRHCETRFIFGPDHRVRSVSFEGDGCVAEELKKGS